jgi:flagellar motility protein MotE (MotC chaperone)
MILERLENIANALKEITDQKQKAIDRRSESRSDVDINKLTQRMASLEREVKDLPLRFLRRQ